MHSAAGGMFGEDQPAAVSRARSSRRGADRLGVGHVHNCLLPFPLTRSLTVRHSRRDLCRMNGATEPQLKPSAVNSTMDL